MDFYYDHAAVNALCLRLSKGVIEALGRAQQLQAYAVDPLEQIQEREEVRLLREHRRIDREHRHLGMRVD